MNSKLKCSVILDNDNEQNASPVSFVFVIFDTTLLLFGLVKKKRFQNFYKKIVSVLFAKQVYKQTSRKRKMIP